jgi:D-tyrosyl-tRNA(Tyr) deacylase
MRAVVQRVSRARVAVDGAETGAIGRGLAVLLAVANGDDPSAAAYLAEKIALLRIFPDHQGKMNLSVTDIAGAVLVVSQFTLYGDVRRGRRPAFDRSAPPELAQPLYEHFVSLLRQRGLSVETGVFQASMQLELVNEGPVTILADSEKQF